MTKFVNYATQIIGIVTSGLTLFGGFIPTKYQATVVLAVSTIQGVISQIAHNYNPNGTAVAPVDKLPVK